MLMQQRQSRLRQTVWAVACFAQLELASHRNYYFSLRLSSSSLVLGSYKVGITLSRVAATSIGMFIVTLSYDAVANDNVANDKVLPDSAFDPPDSFFDATSQFSSVYV